MTARLQSRHTQTTHIHSHSRTPSMKILILPDLKFSTKEVGREKVNKYNHTSAKHPPKHSASFRREILEAEAKMEKVAGSNGDRISVNCCN